MNHNSLQQFRNGCLLHQVNLSQNVLLKRNLHLVAMITQTLLGVQKIKGTAVDWFTDLSLNSTGAL